MSTRILNKLTYLYGYGLMLVCSTPNLCHLGVTLRCYVLSKIEHQRGSEISTALLKVYPGDVSSFYVT
jgi:hypothetical protein